MQQYIKRYNLYKHVAYQYSIIMHKFNSFEIPSNIVLQMCDTKIQ